MTEHRAKRIEHRERIEGGAGNGRALRMGNGRWWEEYLVGVRLTAHGAG